GQDRPLFDHGALLGLMSANNLVRSAAPWGLDTRVAPRRMSAMARPSRSAGLLPYLEDPDGLHVFLGHMGGPFWARKEVGSWSIIKGIYNPETEDAQDAARREFREEIGVDPPSAEEI